MLINKPATMFPSGMNFWKWSETSVLLFMVACACLLWRESFDLLVKIS